MFIDYPASSIDNCHKCKQNHCPVWYWPWPSSGQTLCWPRTSVMHSSECSYYQPNKLNTLNATDELSRQLMCIGKCHWRVYSTLSTGNSAVHRHHSR